MHRSTKTLALALLALTLGLAACSDEEDGEPAGGAAGRTADTQADETATAPGTDTDERTDTAGRPGYGDGDGGGATAPSGGSPEDQPGGAGDEVPASSQVLVVGRDGGFHPTVVHVPPFIAIRVELRSEDGAAYELRAKGRGVRAGGDGGSSASALFEGLRPGERLVLRGEQGRVVVKPDAEPGP